MAFGLSDDDELGLVFPSEMNENESPSILFTTPIPPYALLDQFDLKNFMEQNTFYFPFLLNQEYYEPEAKIDFPKLTFPAPKTNFGIAFEIAFIFIDKIPGRSISNPSSPKYIGNNNRLIPENDGFLILFPVNLSDMDKLYLEHGGVFVGLTPDFGESLINDDTTGPVTPVVTGFGGQTYQNVRVKQYQQLSQ